MVKNRWFEHDTMISKMQFFFYFLLCFRGGRGGQGQNLSRRDKSSKITEIRISGSKFVSPIDNTMAFIHCKTNNFRPNFLQNSFKIFTSARFRADKNEGRKVINNLIWI
eukprot:Pompholyxophrys_punicea_v1_NODE_777_length_1311_cov_2.640924.p2 type:complete len:109 gc:universal NODE_777_length_1311_cov_2.640924:739-413(-)